MKVGVLFATEREAQPFRGQLRGRDVIVRVAAEMGMEQARVCTQQLIQSGVEWIINAGVCGALDDELQRHAVYLVDTVSNEEKVAFSVKHDIPTRRYPLKKLVTVAEPLFDAGRKAELLAYGDLVDMEGFAVAKECKQAKLPCLLLKGVTDFCDEGGKAAIQTHLHCASERVADAVIDVMDILQKETDTSDDLDLSGMCRSRHGCKKEIDEEGKDPFENLLSFTKVEHIIFSLPLLFAGAWLGAEGWPAWNTLLLIALVGLGGRTFGMSLNRLFDRDIDAKNPRTSNRELPSGKLTVGQGVAVALLGLLVYLVGCVLLGATVIKWFWAPLLPLTFYSLLKRFTPLCHYGIGLCLAAAPLGAYIAVTNSVAFTPRVLWLALFAGCWISGFDMIYALMDLEFDRANGVRSIPAALGEKGAMLVAGLTHVVAIYAMLNLTSSAWSRLAAGISIVAFVAGYWSRIPIPVRFFPISAIAGIAGACVVLLR